MSHSGIESDIFIGGAINRREMLRDTLIVGAGLVALGSCETYLQVIADMPPLLPETFTGKYLVRQGSYPGDYVSYAHATLVPDFIAEFSQEIGKPVQQKSLSDNSRQFLSKLALSPINQTFDSMRKKAELRNAYVGYSLGVSAFKDRAGRIYDAFCPLTCFVDDTDIDHLLTKLKSYTKPQLGVGLALDRAGNRIAVFET